jgi:GNAT superfamily N-acetyltransferase
MAEPSAGGFTIREIRPEEYEALGELTVRAYAAVPGAADTDYFPELRNVARRAALLPVLVAVAVDGRLLGGVAYVSGPGTPYAESQRPDEAGFRMLAVEPSEGGRGIGRALAEACIARARAAGRGGMAIYSRPTRSFAHRLYDSLGFARDPSRDWEFAPGEWLWSFVLRFVDPG